MLRQHHSDVQRTLTALFERRLDLAADATRVALLQYGKSVAVPVSLGGYHEREQLARQITQFRAIGAGALGRPDVTAAYGAAIQQFDSFGRGGEVPRVLLLISDGEDM